MTFTSAELFAWLGGYFWPFCRIGAMLMAAPIYGTRTVAVRLRLGLALAVTLVAAPLLPPVPAVDPLSIPGVMVTANELLLGVAMGFVLRVAFAAVEIAGQVIGQLMGLGFASMLDPQYGVAVPVVSQFYTVLAVLIFLALDGHLMAIEAVVQSFRHAPIAGPGLTSDGLWMLISWGSHMFAGAVAIALPAIAALLLINVAFAVMTRAAPQLNIFAVGFPVTLTFGFVVMLMALPGMAPQFARIAGDALQSMRLITGG